MSLLDILDILVSLHLHFAVRFVDRDMLMRFLGLGIGHKGQANCIVPSNKAAIDALVANDANDQDMESTVPIVRSRNLTRRPRRFDISLEAVGDIQDGDDIAFYGDPDVDSDSGPDSDDGDDLDGHL